MRQSKEEKQKINAKGKTTAASEQKEKSDRSFFSVYFLAAGLAAAAGAAATFLIDLDSMLTVFPYAVY